jgi:hypothetical protein
MDHRKAPLTHGQAGPADPTPRGDPREVGELLATWVGVKLDEIDDLTDEAHRKVAALPEQRVLWELVGELVIELRMLDHQVTALKQQVAALQKAVRRE